MGRLTPLLYPESIAIVGANDDTTSYGGRLWNYVTRYFPGRAYAVNRRPHAIRHGWCAAELSALPEAPDVVVLATPSRTVPDLLAEAGRIGARAVIVLDRESLGRERDLRTIADAEGMLLLGPNCLGLIHGNASVPLSSSISLDRSLRPGPYAFVSQSGALMGVLHACAADTGLGLGLLVSTGSQAQIRVEDVLREIAGLDEIRAVAAYLEDLDVPLFEAAARALAAQDKRLIVLKGGMSARGGEATAAHSRSLASNGDTFRALAREVGATVVRDTDELLAALALSETSGPRLSLATISGGLAVVGTDQAVRFGLPLADLSLRTQATLCDLGVPTTNPLDLESVVSTDQQKADAIAALAADPGTDTTLVVLNDMPGLTDLLQRLGPVVDRAKNRLAVCSACSRQEDPLLQDWVAGGRSYVEGLSTALSALAALHPVQAPESTMTTALEEQLLPSDALRLLSSAGIPMARGREVATPEEACRAAAEFGYPIVLKVAHAGHRGTAGVRIGLLTQSTVRAAFEELREHVPLLMQPQAQPGLEFYVGTAADPRFGLLLFLGMGGARPERTRDVAVTRCPVDRDAIRQLLTQTAVGRWLDNAASRHLVDLDALVEVACHAVEVSLRLGPQFQSLDLNPVIVHASGATVVDAKITLTATTGVEAAFSEVL